MIQIKYNLKNKKLKENKLKDITRNWINLKDYRCVVYYLSTILKKNILLFIYL